jgi:hypothetical protein
MEFGISSLIVTITVFSLFSCGQINDKSYELKNNSSDSQNHSLINNDTTTASILFLKNGINYIDLNGDSINDMVIAGYRNNITAHSFSYYTFYIYQKNLSEDNLSWGIVEINGQEKYSISTYQGADGILSDIAFVKNNAGKYELIKADINFEKNFTDSAQVKYSYYSLKYDSLENRYLYEINHDKYSKFKYIDVHEAISRELK